MSAQRRYTVADLAEFPPEMRTELFDGVLIVDGVPVLDRAPVVTPSPFARHQRLCRRLSTAIDTYLDAHGGGEVFFEIDVIFDEHNTCRPDLIVVGDDQRDIIEGHVHGAPKLVIEILSDPRHDRIRKRATYARFGVAEYWIVDPEADRIEVYRLDGDRYTKPTVLEPGEALTTPFLPGLEIDLTQLFRG